MCMCAHTPGPQAGAGMGWWEDTRVTVRRGWELSPARHEGRPPKEATALYMEGVVSKSEKNYPPLATDRELRVTFLGFSGF